MRVIKRCPTCNEPLSKATAEIGGVMLMGRVLMFPGKTLVVCPACKEHHPLDTSFTVAVKHGVILPDRPVQHR